MRARRPLATLVLLAGLAVLAGCGPDRDRAGPAEGDPGTTATTEAAAGDVVEDAPARATDPERAGFELVAAWRRGDRQGAAPFATPAVIDQLFRLRPPATGQSAQDPGCTRDGQRHRCDYEVGPDLTLSLQVRGDRSRGYRVTGLDTAGGRPG
jgi:hypothetical protein